MAKKQPAAQPRPTRHPEKKIGPFSGGIGGVAIWLNTATTDDGPKQFRSITIAPRRYLDRETGEWKDAGSFNPGDLPALIYALTNAQTGHGLQDHLFDAGGPAHNRGGGASAVGGMEPAASRDPPRKRIMSAREERTVPPRPQHG